jgi:hypothetical protein
MGVYTRLVRCPALLFLTELARLASVYSTLQRMFNGDSRSLAQC